MNIEQFVSRGLLSRIPHSEDLAKKEWHESGLDLSEAKKELKSNGYKWAIIKSYYSMFHAAKAILFQMGLKERSHFVIGEVLELISKDGKLESHYVNDFMIVCANETVKDFHDVSAKQTIRIPNCFGKKIVFGIDLNTKLPLLQEIYDEKGLFERYELKSFILDPKFDKEEFTSGYKGYHF